MDVQLVQMELASHSNPEIWAPTEVAVLLEKDNLTIEEFLQGMYGSNFNIRNIVPGRTLHLVQYIMVHNQAQVNKIRHILNNYRSE